MAKKVIVLVACFFAANLFAADGPYVVYRGTAGTSLFKSEIMIPVLQENPITFVPKIHFFYEKHEDHPSNASDITLLPKHMKMYAPGAIFAKNTDWGTVFAMSSVYQNLGKRLAASMFEAYLGTVFKNPTYNATAALRFRRFPHGNRYLPILGIDYKLDETYAIDAMIPSHLYFKLTFGAHRLTFGAQLEGREIATAIQNESYWLDGYELMLLARWHYFLTPMLATRVTTGVAKERLEVYHATTKDKPEKIILSSMRPFVELALVTEVP